MGVKREISKAALNRREEVVRCSLPNGVEKAAIQDKKRQNSRSAITVNALAQESLPVNRLERGTSSYSTSLMYTQNDHESRQRELLPDMSGQKICAEASSKTKNG